MTKHLKRIIITSLLIIKSLITSAVSTVESDKNDVFPTELLVNSGFIVKTAAYKITKDIITKFGGQELPIRLCASFKTNRNGMGSLDSLIVFYNNKPHTIYLGNEDADIILNSLDILHLATRISVEDFNFDGIPDIAVYNMLSGVKNTYETVFIYNKKRGRYFRNKTLSEKCNIKLNTESKTIHTFSQGGMASRIYTSSIYEWKENNLKEVKTEKQLYNDSLHLFIKTTKSLDDTLWVTDIDSLTEDETKW